MRIKRSLTAVAKIMFSYLILSAFFQQTFAAVFDQKQQCLGNGVDYDDAVILAKKLQAALLKGDKEAVVDLADYPLRINKSVREKIIFYYIKDRQQFLCEYRSVITKNVEKSILNAIPTDIGCNYQGGMIGHGIVWFYPQNPPTKFTTINVD